ncbi:MAG: PaaI family thioesterase [Planctomycetota bacterium]
MSDRFSTAPISQLIGFDVVPAKEQDVAESRGHAVVHLECDQRLHNPMGRVHGGVVSALADAAMGIAFGRTLLPSEDFSTVEMKVSFMRPVKAGRLTATANVTQRGLRIGFVECQIHGSRGKLIATGSCTCTVI